LADFLDDLNNDCLLRYDLVAVIFTYIAADRIRVRSVILYRKLSSGKGELSGLIVHQAKIVVGRQLQLAHFIAWMIFGWLINTKP